MEHFLNSKVKTHTENALQYIFDENKDKFVILGYSIVSRRSPQVRIGQKKIPKLFRALPDFPCP